MYVKVTEKDGSDPVWSRL